jgi:hypothetical protein
MKGFATVVLLTLGVLLAARTEAARLPHGTEMVNRLHVFHQTHTLRPQVRHSPLSVNRIGRFHETHTLRQPSR